LAEEYTTTIFSFFINKLNNLQDLLVNNGLLMPPFLANVIPSYMYDLIRDELQKEENKKFKYETGIMDQRIENYWNAYCRASKK
jgi:hypothetical protein